MTYRVVIQPRAAVEMEEAFQWIAGQSPRRAAQWLDGLQRAIDSLRTNPRRCSLAREGEGFNQEVRQLLYGKRHGVYRILYLIRGEVVYVLTIRHSARQPAAIRQLVEDVEDTP
jgi:plasmid stabilization system protein ParE